MLRTSWRRGSLVLVAAFLVLAMLAVAAFVPRMRALK